MTDMALTNGSGQFLTSVVMAYPISKGQRSTTSDVVLHMYHVHNLANCLAAITSAIVIRNHIEKEIQLRVSSAMELEMDSWL